MKQFEKTLAIILAMCLALTAVIVPMGVMADDVKEIIANDGSNAAGTTALQLDCTEGQVSVSQLNDGTYGKSIGLVTGDVGSNWNWYKTALNINVPSNYDVSKATGFAFYAKFPQVDADTALDIWWYISDNAYWNELCQGQPIYYLAKGSDELITSTFSWGDYTLPGHNKAGWEGFIFVPFTSLNAKYDGQDRDIIDAARNFQLRVGIAGTNEALANQTFGFDELGLYTVPADYVKAAVLDKTDITDELVVNDGSDIGMVNPQWDCTDQVTVSQVEDVTPYGKAIALTTGVAGCGWNNYKTGIVMPRGDNDISGMKGFAFYAKVPDVGENDPAIDVLYWNSDNRCWNEFVDGAPIYYIEKGSTEITSTEFHWGDYTLPLHNKSGWEGFVFVPFTSMHVTWGGNEGIDIENLNNYNSFEFRVSVAKTDDVFANQTYIFDEIGFYTDPLEYMVYVEQQNASRVEVKPVEYVANDAAVLSAWSDLDESFSVRSTAVANTGRAYSLYTGGEHANWYWAHFAMPHNDVDISATSGIAFYAEIPDDLDNCRIQVRFYIDDDHFYNDPLSGKNMYYLANGSDTVETKSVTDYPFYGKKGYKGWFFLPYSAMQRNGTTTNAAAVNAAENFQVQVCMISGDAADFNREYIIDQVGFYSDPKAYVAAATSGYGKVGDTNNNDGLDADDVINIRKAILGDLTIDDKVFHSCDTTVDGYIDVRDIIRFKKLLAEV